MRQAKASSAGSNPSTGSQKLPLVAVAVLTLTLALGVALAAANPPTAGNVFPSQVGYTTATVGGEVNPENYETSCRFNYIADAQFQDNLLNALDGFEGAEQAPCSPEVLTKLGTQGVKAELSGLQPATEYHLRLVAFNQDGEQSAEASGTFTTEPPSAPVISKTLSRAITGSSVTLSSSINPAGSSTSYRFEYVTQAEFQVNGFANAVKAPQPDEAIGSGAEVSVSRSLTELTPDTSYRFRVVAVNASGTSEGAPKSFHTFGFEGTDVDACPNAGIRAAQEAQNLSDCRAFELVSPVQKNGADVAIAPEHTRAATDGSAVNFSSLAGFGDTSGAGLLFEYMAVRTPSGWATHSLMPPNQEPQNAANATQSLSPFYGGELSDDLTTGVTLALSPLTDDPNVSLTRNLYRRGDLRIPGKGSYQLVTKSETPVPATGKKSYRPFFAGASATFDHVIFESSENLTADATGSLNKLYEWYDGAVRLVGILPNGQPATCANGTEVCSIAGRGVAMYSDSAISRDGSRIVFTVPKDFGNVDGQMYMRIDGVETIQLNLSEKSSPDASQPALFSGASLNGSKVFFKSEEQLTDTPGSGLYEYDASKPAGDPNNLRLVVPGESNNEVALIGVSTDGSYAYVASGESQLVEGAPSFSSSYFGMYLLRGGQLHFVGFVPDDDVSGIAGETSIGLAIRLSRTTPDGHALAFLASDGAGLTGKVNESLCPGRIRGCLEAYVYDADANGGEGEVSCASCNPSGVAPSSDASFQELFGGAALAPRTSHLSQALSTDGKRVFFTTSERLLQGDINGEAKDVYEYDVQSHVLNLITTGRGSEDSYLLDASNSGDDVFIATGNRLLARDNDGGVDLYDVKVNGGFPEPPAPAVCEGDACLVPPTAPNDPTPASSAFNGAGNVKTRAKAGCHKSGASARKGTKRSRCAKAKKQHTKKQHTKKQHKRSVSKRTAKNDRRASR